MPKRLRAIVFSEIALFQDDWALLLKQKGHFRFFVRCFLSQFCDIGTITKVSDRPHKFVRITNLWDHNFVRITILWDHKIVRSQSQNVLTKLRLITNRDVNSVGSFRPVESTYVRYSIAAARQVRSKQKNQSRAWRLCDCCYFGFILICLLLLSAWVTFSAWTKKRRFKWLLTRCPHPGSISSAWSSWVMTLLGNGGFVLPRTLQDSDATMVLGRALSARLSISCKWPRLPRQK